jgi:hypothetical protein
MTQDSESSPHQKESFVRWQSITITQLGYALNLTLGFAAASLGFLLTLLKDREFTPSNCGKWAFVVSLLSHLLSMGLGVWCVLNRLADFRETTQIAGDRAELKRKGKSDTEIDSELKPRRDEVKRKGKCTWLLFKAQIVTFVIGLLTLTAAVATTYLGRLFP